MQKAKVDALNELYQKFGSKIAIIGINSNDSTDYPEDSFDAMKQTAKEKGFEDNKKQIGLSAQQVKEVLPEIVHSAPFDTDFDKDGNMFSKSGEDYLTLKYDRLVPLLVEGIKEQTELIKTQQK